jgi:hypothetical protein
VSKAEATMLKCLGATPTAAVKPFLDHKKIKEAWQVLHEKYEPKDDTDVIRELDAHVKEVRLKHPSRIDEYIGTIDRLRAALLTCGMKKSDKEMIAIIKDGILCTTEGAKAFTEIFRTARLLRWNKSEVMEALATKAHAMTQEQGIEALQKMDISREIERRGTPKPSNLSPQATASQGAAQSTPQGKGGSPKRGSDVKDSAENVAGSNGRMNPDIDCYRCKKWGHIAKFCPNKTTAAQSTATTEEGNEPAETEGKGANVTSNNVYTEEIGSPVSQGASFEIEMDVSYEEIEGEYFASHAKMLQLFSSKG